MLFAVCPVSTAEEEISMIEIERTAERLQDHLRELTVTIGERSVLLPKNLKKTVEYIETFYQDIGLPVHLRILSISQFYGCQCGDGNLFL